MPLRNVTFPPNYREFLHDLIDAYVSQGAVLSSLVRNERFFESGDKQSDDSFKIRSLGLIAELNEGIAGNSLLLKDLIESLDIRL